MTDEQHREMADVLRSLKGMVIISSYPSELYDNDLFTDWKHTDKAAHADGALDRIERLWISPNIQSMSLF